METIKNKCSLDEHSNVDTVIFCQDCMIFMCNKCEKVHSEIFKKHNKFKFDRDIKDLFTGFCREKYHTKLKYFCKSHNKLCCAACISKIQDLENGQHFGCNVCNIKDIENEKKIN